MTITIIINDDGDIKDLKYTDPFLNILDSPFLTKLHSTIIDLS